MQNGASPEGDAPPADDLAAKLVDSQRTDLTRLFHPHEHVSVCHQVPGGPFLAKVVRAADVPAEVARWDGIASVWVGLNPLDLPVTVGDHGVRGGNANVTRLAALLVDLDLDGKLTNDTIPELIEDLVKILDTQPVEKNFTGHGVQVLFAVEETAEADLSTPQRRADAMATVKRFGRLVKRLARDHGGTTDSVYDLARVRRVPGTVNFKKGKEPVQGLAFPVGEDWRPISLDELRDLLEAQGVPEYDEDREVLGSVVSDPHGWGWAKHSCGYVQKMIDGWSTDTPAARHPWLLGQATRLAAAHRHSGLTEAEHARAVQVLTGRMGHLCASQEPRRAVGQTEIEDALRWGVARVAAMSDDRVASELGYHRHDDGAHALDGILADGPQDPASALVSPSQTEAGPWTPLDLSSVVEGLVTGSLKRPVPTVGVRTDGKALFYRGKVNGVAGASGSGKSWDALLACVQAIAGGEHAVYIDYESDAAETVGRLLDLGADPAAITARFHYLQPDQRLGEDGAAALAELVRATRAAVVVIDSVGESMAVEGDSPNDDDDTARWFRRFPTMLARLGPAVVVIDHVTKADDREPGLWPIGSQRKRAAISGAQYMQRMQKPFAKGQPGTARIICAKDRGGNYRQNEHVATLTVTPDGPVLMELRAPATATDDGDTPRTAFRPTFYMERISRALEAAPEPLSQNAVLDPAVVKGKESTKTAALRVLVAEKYVRQSDGPRNSKLHESVRSYRQADDPRSDSYVGDRETVTDSSTTATVAVSMEKETGDGRSTVAGRRSGDGRATVAGQQLLAVGAPS